jgi:uncharacterized protein
LGATDLAVRGAVEVAIVGNPADTRFVALAGAVASRYVPSLVMAGGLPASAAGIAVLAGRESESPLAYVCKAYTCDAPTDSPEKLAGQLNTRS